MRIIFESTKFPRSKGNRVINEHDGDVMF